MKIAITTTGKDLTSEFESRFGRAPGFIIYDLDEGSFEFIDNSVNLNAPQGAGIQAAMSIIKAGADMLVSGHCGPKAFKVLNEAGVKIYSVEALTVAQAVEYFVAGRFTLIQSADVGGHW